MMTNRLSNDCTAICKNSNSIRGTIRATCQSRSLTFIQEIKDAIKARDRLVLVLGPKAIASAYVKQEWEYAYYDEGKVVTPILRLGDYKQIMPEEFKLLSEVHWEDFREDSSYDFHLTNLARRAVGTGAAAGEIDRRSLSAGPLPASARIGSRLCATRFGPIWTVR